MTDQQLTKQLLYRSQYRGCKETDHLIGKFVTKNINSFSQEVLKLLESFLSEDDTLIYDWILHKKEIPVKYQQLILQIRNFHKINDA